MRSFVFIMASMISGCAMPEKVITVEVPIVTPCKINVSQRPLSYFDRLPKDSSLFESVKALLADRANTKAYEIELETAIMACN